MAGFLGTEVPVWDAGMVYAEDMDICQNMLVRSTKLGASLAQALGPGTDGLPRFPVALMRGHGFVCTADSIAMVISKCIYTAQNARVQMAATTLAGGQNVLFLRSEKPETRARQPSPARRSHGPYGWQRWKAIRCTRLRFGNKPQTAGTPKMLLRHTADVVCRSLQVLETTGLRLS